MSPRKGNRMTVAELMSILSQVPLGREPIVISRANPRISVSIPDGPLPVGWEQANEISFQTQPGWRRIRWGEFERGEDET